MFFALVGACLGIWWCCFRHRKRPDPTPGPASPLTYQAVSTDKEVSKVGGTVADNRVGEIDTSTVPSSISRTAVDAHQDQNSWYYYAGHSPPSLINNVPVAHPYQDGAELDASTYHGNPYQSSSGHPEREPRPSQGLNYRAPEGIYELGHLSN